jgi:hypothetical protein
LRLDIDLLDHLATKLPNLTHLWIAVEEILSNREVGDLGVRIFLLLSFMFLWKHLLFVPLQHAFFEDLKGHSYPHWKLQDISIWQGGQEIDHDAMLVFAHNIPSVTSFFLSGHMQPP